MKKTYAFFILLISIYIVTCTNKTDVFYDAKYDIIFHNGKLYFPSKNTDINNGAKNDISNNNAHGNTKTNTNTNINSHHEEELVSGATFWFYIFIILCKF